MSIVQLLFSETVRVWCHLVHIYDLDSFRAKDSGGQLSIIGCKGFSPAFCMCGFFFLKILCKQGAYEGYAM